MPRHRLGSSSKVLCLKYVDDAPDAVIRNWPDRSYEAGAQGNRTLIIRRITMRPTSLSVTTDRGFGSGWHLKEI